MSYFKIDNVQQSLEQSGLAGVVLNDNAAPAANVLYSSLKTSTIVTAPATATSLGTIQLAGALTGTATSPQLANASITSSNIVLGGPSELFGSNSASSAGQNITLGSGLSMSAGGVLSSTGGASPATTVAPPGTIILAGDLGGTGTVFSAPVITNNAVTYAKMQKAVGADVLLGNPSAANTNYSEVTLLAGGGLSFTGNALGVSLGTITTGTPLSVSKGGTGASTLTGYLSGNGTSPITGSTTIPATAITPNLVGMVNGVSPASAGGNVAVVLGNVTTGVLSALPPQPQPNGDIYVVSGDPTPANNGRTFISDGATWNEVTNNLATTDARYVQLAGSTMNASANLVFPSTGHITLNQTVFSPTDAITAGQAATLISAGAPPATTTTQGLIQLGALAFDPSSTASAPVAVKASTTYGAIQLPASPGTPLTNSLVQGASAGIALIAPGAVSLAQMANLSGNSQLIGSSSTGPTTPTAITLGTGLSITGTTLAVTSAPVPNATSTTLGVITLSNDLSGVPNTGGGLNGPTIGANVVTYGKMQKVVLANALLGNSSGVANSNVNEIALSPAFSLTGNTLSLVPASLPQATASAFGTIELGGDLAGTIPAPSSAAAPTITANAVQYSKIQQSIGPNVVLGALTAGQNLAELTVGGGLVVGASSLGLANLSGTSELIGSSSTSAAATNLTLGAGLQISGTVMSVNSATLVVPPATASTIGGIEMLGDLAGSVATLPTVAPLAITTAKMANLSGTSELIGSSSTSAAATNITLGSGLLISGTAMNIITSYLTAEGTGASIAAGANIVFGATTTSNGVDITHATNTANFVLTSGTYDVVFTLNGTANAGFGVVTNPQLGGVSFGVTVESTQIGGGGYNSLTGRFFVNAPAGGTLTILMAAGGINSYNCSIAIKKMF